MEISKLVKFLEDNKFKKDEGPQNSIERFNAMLDRLEGKAKPDAVYTRLFKGRNRDCDVSLDATLTVTIRPKKIEAVFACIYPNFIWEEDEECRVARSSSDENEIIDFVKIPIEHKLGDIITSEMMNTVRFSNGQRLSREELEVIKEDYMADDDEEYTDGFETFLEDCGFDTKEEYEEYLKTLD